MVMAMRKTEGDGRPDQAAILSYILQGAKLIGRDEDGHSVISLTVDDWLQEQLVAARAGVRATGTSRGHRDRRLHG
jgi:hypothetical protein